MVVESFSFFVTHCPQVVRELFKVAVHKIELDVHVVNEITKNEERCVHKFTIVLRLIVSNEVPNDFTKEVILATN